MKVVPNDVATLRPVIWAECATDALHLAEVAERRWAVASPDEALPGHALRRHGRGDPAE